MIRISQERSRLPVSPERLPSRPLRRRPKIYTVPQFLKAVAAVDIPMSRSTAVRAMKDGGLQVRRRKNTRGHVSTRIVCHIVAEATTPGTWLASWHMKVNRKRNRDLLRQADRFEVGDIYRFLFAFTGSADDIPLRGGPMTTPQEWQRTATEEKRGQKRAAYERGLIMHGSSRGLYRMNVTDGNWHRPLTSKKAINKEITKIMRLRHEELSQHGRRYARKMINMLRGLTHSQRTAVLSLLEANRRVIRRGIRCSQAQLARELDVYPSLITYHKQTNPLFKQVLVFILGPKVLAMKRTRASRDDLVPSSEKNDWSWQPSDDWEAEVAEFGIDGRSAEERIPK